MEKLACVRLLNLCPEDRLVVLNFICALKEEIRELKKEIRKLKATDEAKAQAIINKHLIKVAK